MWKTINSPIVIAVIAIAALLLLNASQRGPASEISATYDEINRILEDGASDAEKTKAIRMFATEMATQIREGFSQGWSAGSPDKQDEDALFLETKRKIEVKTVKYVDSKWPDHEKILFVLKNGSDEYVARIRVNLEFYKNSVLIDCKNKWVNEIKILEPGQEVAVNEDRQFPKKDNEQEQQQYKSDNVKIVVTSFEIKNIESAAGAE